MGRSKRLKIHPDRDTTAAYAASQPLFSALRTAITSLNTTRANLTIARDIVQSLHVKIANDDQHNDPNRHDAYIAATLKAWLSTTQAFTEVFEELVNIAAADPSEGREAGPRYDEYKRMWGTVKVAREAVEQSIPAVKEDKVDTPNVEGTEDIAMADAHDVSAADLEPASFVNASGKRSMIKPDVAVENHMLPNGTSRTKGSSVRTPPKDDRASKISPAAPSNIQFEDISAEVEARLRAKEEKRTAENAKKADKKRKRLSGSPTITEPKEDSAESFAASKQAKPPQSTRKRTRQGEDFLKDNEHTAATSAPSDVLKKRKETEHATGSRSGNRSGQEKRKKAKS